MLTALDKGVSDDTTLNKGFATDVISLSLDTASDSVLRVVCCTLPELITFAGDDTAASFVIELK